MQESTSLQAVLVLLELKAKSLCLSRTDWAKRAGLPKETLSRLKHRSDCDFRTVRALAEAVQMRVGVLDAPVPDRAGHFPAAVNREYEDRLLDLCASGELDHRRWSACGPGFFMSGLAVMMASDRDADSRGLIELAENLHPGGSEVQVFNRWLERTPLKPSRFLPMVAARRAAFARGTQVRVVA